METITLTKLYEMLAQKIGRTEAECLTQYVEVKVKNELNSKLEILATKDDLYVLKENIHALRSEMHVLRSEMKGDIHALRNEMHQNTISMQRWMYGTFITTMLMILGLYAAIFLKH